jgi:hypothetical protein
MMSKYELIFIISLGIILILILVFMSLHSKSFSFNCVKDSEVGCVIKKSFIGEK